MRSPEDASSPLDRRTFLKVLAAGLSFIPLEHLYRRAGGSALSARAQSFPFQPAYDPGLGFPQSVASGDPTPTGAVLWTRVDSAVARGIDNAAFDWQLGGRLASLDTERIPEGLPPGFSLEQFVLVAVSTDADFRQIVLRGLSPIWADFDNVVKLDLDGELEPSRAYFYRFVTFDGHVSRTGRFKTLPPATSSPARLRIGQIVCQDYTNGYYAALRHLAVEDLDFVVHLGDYVYESVGDPSYQNPLPDRTIALPSGGIKAMTLEDYRTLYRTYRGDRDLQQFHEAHAIVAIWDDHEFANDSYAPAVAPDDSPDPDIPRREAANQAWFEYMPVRVSFGGPDGMEVQPHRAFAVGDLATIVLTDERLYRSPHPCGEAEVFQRYFSLGCPRQFAPSQSMLGPEQRDWFIQTVTGATTHWKIWANEVQLVELKLLGRFLNLDAWDGFAGERRRILRAFEAADVENLLVLTGDFHTFEANTIPLVDGQRGPVGVELMVGSVSSSNLGDMVGQLLGGAASAASAPMSHEALRRALTELRGDLSGSVLDILGTLQQAVKIGNPWIRYFDSIYHGYAVLELTPEQAVWTAYAVTSITDPTADRFVLWQLAIPAGQAAIEPLQVRETVPAQ